MKIKFFEESKIETLEDLKKQYRSLMLKWHPDRNLNNQEEATANSKIINNEYEYLFNKYKNIHKNNKNEFYEKETTEMASEFQEIINQLIKYKNITIEIIGSWLWVSGSTYEIKEVLKSLDFKFSKQKKSWYFHFNEWHSSGVHFQTLEDLKGFWGFETVQKAQKETLNKLTFN